jgi:cyclohexanecarboxylate-CoA ligase
MGARLEQRGDQLVCHGADALAGADLSSFNDHRVLMALAVAATRASGETRLTYPNAYRISYPRFLQDMGVLDLDMTIAPGSARGRASRRPAPGARAEMSVDHWVRRWARERPDDTAVVDLGCQEVPGCQQRGERAWTWRELDAQADAAAMLLLELGVRSGEPVAYQLPNYGEFIVITLAVLRAGAVCCPLMPIFREREMAAMLRKSGARTLFVPGLYRGRDYAAETAALLAGNGAEPLPVEHVIVTDETVPSAAAGTRCRWHSLATAAGRQAIDRAALDARAPGPDAVVQLLFTSGTSGEPKGVLQRMDSLTRAAMMEISHLGLADTDRIYVPSPLAHQTGFLYGMWLSFILGVPQVLQPVWEGTRALRALRRWRGTFIQAAPPFLSDLVHAVEQTGEKPESLRIFVATGAAVPRALAQRATETLGTAVCGAWGSTETCLGSLSAPGDDPAKAWGSDGRPLHGVELRVTNEAGRVLAPGQEGNFQVRTPCLFEGYLDHPEWTAEAVTGDGWYRTGDLAVIDAKGFVHITGRVKDVINRGGEKIPVAEIEQLLHTHPLVREVAIVAMPDERLGERACAFVVAEPGFDLAEMRRFLEERRVTRQYWPEWLEVIAEMPRNPVGKIKKFALRELAAAGQAGERR